MSILCVQIERLQRKKLEILKVIIPEQFIKHRKLWLWSPHQVRFDIFNDDEQRVQ